MNLTAASLEKKASLGLENDLSEIWDWVYLGTSFLWLLFGVGGNLMIIISVVAFDELRTIPMALAANLAGSDLIVSGANVATTWVTLVEDRAFLPSWDLVCSVSGCICGIGCMSSFFSVSSIALNRYTAVCHPSKYSLIYNKLTTPLFAIGVYLIGLFVMLPAITGIAGAGWAYDRRQLICVRSYFAETGYSSIQWWESVLTIPPPTIILSFTYYKVFQTVHKSGKAVNKNRQGGGGAGGGNNPLLSNRDIHLMKTLVVTIALFYAMSFPWALLVSFDFNDQLHHGFYYASILLLHTSPCVNPFVYASRIPQFKRSFKKILSVITCGIVFGQS